MEKSQNQRSFNTFSDAKDDSNANCLLRAKTCTGILMCIKLLILLTKRASLRGGSRSQRNLTLIYHVGVIFNDEVKIQIQVCLAPSICSFITAHRTHACLVKG
jgi:hypothetical protein